MTVFVSVIGFAVCLLVCYYIYSFFRSEKITPQERLESYLKPQAPEPGSKDNVGRLVEPPVRLTNWRARVRDSGSFLDATAWAKKIENNLVKAGINLRASEFMMATAASILLFLLVFYLFSGGSAAAGLIGAITGYLLPVLVVKRKTFLRRKHFNDQLADTLVLISSSLRSGYSFMQAVEMVSREMQPPISEEFYRVLREINLGVTTDEAMSHMAERINSVDLDLVVTAVLIQRQIGGNLTEILDNIANTIRERVRITGHIRTLTAQGRLSGIIICLLPFAMVLIIYLLNPAYIMPLFTNPLGKLMVAAAVVNEVFGVILIKRIVDIKV